MKAWGKNTIVPPSSAFYKFNDLALRSRSTPRCAKRTDEHVYENDEHESDVVRWMVLPITMIEIYQY